MIRKGPEEDALFITSKHCLDDQKIFVNDWSEVVLVVLMLDTYWYAHRAILSFFFFTHNVKVIMQWAC